MERPTDRRSPARRLSAVCRPFFATSVAKISVEIAEQNASETADDVSVTVEVRSSSGGVVWKSAIWLKPPLFRTAFDLPQELHLQPGRYFLAATAGGPVVLQDFVVTEPHFETAANKARQALVLHAQASDAARNAKFDFVTAPLWRAAQLFSEAESTLCAVAAWRDVAAANLLQGNQELAREACRRGLWVALTSACDAVPGAVQSGWGAARGPLTLDLDAGALAQELAAEVCDYFAMMPELDLAPEATRLNVHAAAVRGTAVDLARLVALLTSLGQRDDLLRNILKALLPQLTMTSIAYRCLNAIDSGEAFAALPEVVQVAIAHQEDSSITKAVEDTLHALPPSQIYEQLPYVVRDMSDRAKDFVIPIILRAHPIDAVVVNDVWHLYQLGRFDMTVGRIPNGDADAAFLAPHFTTATFSEARQALEAQSI
jgi:hypothetical protein